MTRLIIILFYKKYWSYVSLFQEIDIDLEPIHKADFRVSFYSPIIKHNFIADKT